MISPAETYLVIHDSEIPLEPLVIVKQCLRTNKIFAIVVRGKLRLLLLHPLDSFIDIPSSQSHEHQQTKMAGIAEQTDPRPS